MNNLSKERLILWAKRYERIDSDIGRKLEKELTERIQRNSFVTVSDLVEVNRWKFESTMPGRFKRQINLIRNSSDKIIVEKTNEALNLQNDEEKLKIMASLRCGIGNAVGSAILMFHDPRNYGVFDIHAWRELFERDARNMSDPKNAVRFFEKLREISSSTGLDCRTVEKALFTKNYEESKTSRLEAAEEGF